MSHVGQRVRLCGRDEIEPGTARRFDVGKTRIAIVRIGDDFYAIGDRCTHADLSLAEGEELLGLPTWRRAQAGLFLAMQYPIEVPGVSLEDGVAEAFAASGRDRQGIHALVRTEAGRIGFEERFLTRPLNVDLSGGEK